MKKTVYSRILILLMAMMLLALSAGCATTSTVRETPAAAEPSVITDIRLGDNSLTIVSNRHFAYTMYKGNDPYRMTIDIPDMGAGIFTGKILSDKAGISEVIPEQTDSPVRSLKISLVLQNPSTIGSYYKDNTLTLTITPEEPAAVSEKPKEAAEPPPAKKTPEEAVPAMKETMPEVVREAAPESVIAYIPKATEIVSVEVNRTADEVKVVIQGNGSMMPNVFPIDERIVIDIPGVVMNAAVPSKAVSPLKGIRVGKHKEKVRLVLDLKEKTKFEVTAIGKSIEVALKARSAEGSVSAQGQASPRMAARKMQHAEHMKEARQEANAREANAEPAVRELNNKDLSGDTNGKIYGKFSGKNISLDFQDAEIGPIFRLLADVNGYNLVLDPSIRGKITIKLMNVPWDQALSIILSTFNLGKSLEGNILWIAPQAVFDKIVEVKSASKATEEKAEELFQEIIRINYATSSDINGAITSGKLLSARGSVTTDTRMNTLIIKDTQGSIVRIKELVKIMDVTKPQVMIEAKLVEVSTTHSEALGIRWGGAANLQSGPYPVSGTFAVNTPVLTPGAASINPGGTLGMTVGAANRLKVDLSLSALESITKAKTLSSPKILTMDNEAATIQQGTTFYIPTVSQSGTSSTAVTATLSLSVTPKITPDGYIQLKVTATDNSLQPGTAGSEAVVNTKSIMTQALVKNGETLVLGGIYRRDESTSEDGVPVLSKIPGLGWLFKTKTSSGPDIKELLIFITPTIIAQQAENNK
ncbi:MAG: type IV pilus secretin PilQ [Nitrospirae bacterium]|nr:MAG: type IV pilus secretin PilQ [Nitrospirota bacterium]